MNELRIRRLILDALTDAAYHSDRKTAVEYETLIDSIENGDVVIGGTVPSQTS